MTAETRCFFLVLLASSAAPLPALADQETFSAYNTRFRATYWSELYPNGGFEFYCGERFDAFEGSTPPGMSLEHAYAAQWMVEALECGANRVQCRGRL